MDVTYKNRDVNWMSTVQGKSQEQDNSMTEQFSNSFLDNSAKDLRQLSDTFWDNLATLLFPNW